MPKAQLSKRETFLRVLHVLSPKGNFLSVPKGVSNVSSFTRQVSDSGV